MRIIIAAAIVLSLAGAAYAQMPGINLAPGDKPRDPEKEAKQEEIDRAYRDATKGKANVNAPNDPWAAVRGAEQPAKPAAKPGAKPKTAAQTQGQSNPAPRTQPQAQSQSPWPSAPSTQAQSQPQGNSPWPAAPTPR